MTNKEFIKYHTTLCDRLKDIAKAKSHDYSQDEDVFANFKSIEVLDVCTTEQGFLTRMLDKFNRVKSFTKRGILKVEDEKIEDTLLDLANYSILLAAYIKDKKDNTISDVKFEKLPLKSNN